MRARVVVALLAVAVAAGGAIVLARRHGASAGSPAPAYGASVASQGPAHGASAIGAAAPPSSVYAALARQLRHQLPRLAPALAAAVKQAESRRPTPAGHQRPLGSAPPTTQRRLRRLQQIQGYACAVATGASCSLHPCVEYAQSALATTASATADAAAVVPRATTVPRAITPSPAVPDPCSNKKANPAVRLIPIRMG